MVAGEMNGNQGSARRVLVLDGVSAAIGVASERPGVLVDAFEPTWRDVDRGREVVEARGLTGRIHVWHVSAVGLARRVMGDRTLGR